LTTQWPRNMCKEQSLRRYDSSLAPTCLGHTQICPKKKTTSSSVTRHILFYRNRVSIIPLYRSNHAALSVYLLCTRDVFCFFFDGSSSNTHHLNPISFNNLARSSVSSGFLYRWFLTQAVRPGSLQSFFIFAIIRVWPKCFWNCTSRSYRWYHLVSQTLQQNPILVKTSIRSIDMLVRLLPRTNNSYWWRWRLACKKRKSKNC
jgi:hypothetical protein